jgi:hypothetical protein
MGGFKMFPIDFGVKRSSALNINLEIRFLGSRMLPYYLESPYHTYLDLPKERRRFFSCETVALWENGVDRPESYNLIIAKSCAFLVHGLGYISPFPYTICPKARYKKNSYVIYLILSYHH